MSVFKVSLVSRVLAGSFTFSLIAIMGLILSGALFGSGLAGQKQADLEYKVTYACSQNNNNYEFKVLSCDDNDWCQVFIANKFSPGGGNVTGQSKSTTLSLIKKWDCSVKGRAPQADVPNDNKPETRDQPAEAKKAGEQTAGECPSDQTLKAKSKSGDPIDLKSKRAILAGYQKAVDAKQYWAVGITFETFQIGSPHANIRGVLFHESAPVGTQIYPVKTKFTVCQRYDREIKRDVMDGRFECFKDAFGEWDCATATGHRTVSTEYEKAPKWKAN